MLNFNKKFIVLILMLFIFIGVTGCDNGSFNDFNNGDPDNGDSYPDDDSTIGEIKVSFIGSESNEVSALVDSGRTHYDFDRENYAYPFNEENEGDLVNTYTPESMIVQIGSLGVSHPNYSMPLIKAPEGEQNHPPTFDLVYSDKIIDASYLIEHERFDFKAVDFTFSTRNNDGSVREFPPISEVHVDLGEEYKDVNFDQAIDKKGTVHVFEMADLIPFSEDKGDALFTSMVFEDGVEEPFILNPDGERVEDLKPHFWDMDARWGRAGYVIYNTGFELDFSQYNHLIFVWELDDLIEIYDNNSEDVNDHIVTFRLDNPLPISLKVDELKEGDKQIEDSNLEEVNHLEALYHDLEEKQVVLRWTNPSVENFDEVKIVKKEGSPPENAGDGEIVYEGNFPIYRDHNVERFKNYYYRVIVLGKDGELTEGEVINIDTTPPQIKEMKFESFTKGEYDIDTVNLKVGEEEMIIVDGFDEEGEYYNIAPDWSFTDPELVEITRNKTDELGFKALKEGETYLEASLDDDLGGITETLKITIEKSK